MYFQPNLTHHWYATYITAHSCMVIFFQNIHHIPSSSFILLLKKVLTTIYLKKPFHLASKGPMHTVESSHRKKSLIIHIFMSVCIGNRSTRTTSSLLFIPQGETEVENWANDPTHGTLERWLENHVIWYMAFLYVCVYLPTLGQKMKTFFPTLMSLKIMAQCVSAHS